MAIEFMCPNGHPLSAPEDRAGKPGKCPKCQTAFVVPELEEDEDDLGATEAVAVRESDPNVFVFLCPNGHKLNGPPTLKGKPGQCPHCHAKFRIPDDEEDLDEAEEASSAADIPLGTIPAAGEVDETIPVEEVLTAAEYEEPMLVGPSPPPPTCGHPVGDFILRLLNVASDDDVKIELRTSDGETFVFDMMSADLSDAVYGVFAVKGGREDYSVVSVSWDAVTVANVKHLAELPAEFL